MISKRALQPAVAPPRLGDRAKTHERRGRTGHNTIQAERSLQAGLREAARRVLGPEASAAAVHKLAEEWYEETPREPPAETAFARRRRERDAAAARADVERHQLKYGDKW